MVEGAAVLEGGGGKGRGMGPVVVVVGVVGEVGGGGGEVGESAAGEDDAEGIFDSASHGEKAEQSTID